MIVAFPGHFFQQAQYTSKSDTGVFSLVSDSDQKRKKNKASLPSAVGTFLTIRKNCKKTYSVLQHIFYLLIRLKYTKNGKRKVQGVPQSQTAQTFKADISTPP